MSELGGYEACLTVTYFSPDGKMLAGNTGATMCLWNDATDLPAITGQERIPRRQAQEIRLGPLELPVPGELETLSAAAPSPAQDYRTPNPLFSFSRLRNVIVTLFNGSRVAPDGVELQERRHRPLRPVRVGNALTKQFVVVSSTRPPRPQALRDVSDDGSATARAAEQGEGGETTAGAQDGASASRSHQAEAANEAVQETRHDDEHVIPSMERSTAYSTAPGISFAVGSVESEDSLETDCCACCPG